MKFETIKDLEDHLDMFLDNAALHSIEPDGEFTKHFYGLRGEGIAQAKSAIELEAIKRFFASYERKIRRRREDLHGLKGTVKAPKIVTKTERTTKEGLLALGDIDATYEAIDGEQKQDSLLTIAKSFVNALQDPAAGFILDTLYQYTEAYFQNGPIERPSIVTPTRTEAFKIDASGEFYCLTTSMEDLFNTGKAKGNISPEDRRKIKQALFPADKSKKGLLEEITFYTTGNDGKPYFLTQKFLFVNKAGGKAERKTKGTLKTGQDETRDPKTHIPEWFELRLNASVFRFLRERDEIKAGKGTGKIGMGYMNLPSYLSIKIARSLNRIELINAESVIGDAIKRNREAYRQATIHALHKWDTGKQNRRGPMSISYGELCDLGYFPKNTKDKSRRTAILHALCRILFDLAKNEEGFPGATLIDVRGVQIVFESALPQ